MSPVRPVGFMSGVVLALPGRAGCLVEVEDVGGVVGVLEGHELREGFVAVGGAAANHWKPPAGSWPCCNTKRQAFLLLVDFWNQAVRDPEAARRFAERHARLRTLIGRIVEGVVATSDPSRRSHATKSPPP